MCALTGASVGLRGREREGTHHRRRRVHRLAPLRAAPRRGLGGLRRSTTSRPGRCENVEHLTDRARLPPRRRLRAEAGGRQRARAQVRRRLPPGGGGRRAADRRAAGAHARHEPRAARRSCSTTATASASACSSPRPRRSTATTARSCRSHEDARRIYGPTTPRRWAYADSKAMDEFLALAYHQERGLDAVIVRLFNTVGPRQSGQYGMVIPRFVERALADAPLEIHGDGNQTRCFCHVHDTIRALHRPDGRRRPPRARSTTSAREERIRILDLAERVIARDRLDVGARVRPVRPASTGRGSRTCSTASRRSRRSTPRSAGSRSARSTRSSPT